MADTALGSPRSSIKVIAACGVSLALGLCGGYFLKSSQDEGVAVQPARGTAPVAARPPPVSHPPETAAKNAAVMDAAFLQDLVSQDADLHRKALTKGIADALATRQPAVRMKAFLELMEHFRPGDSQAVVDGFREHDQKGRLFYAEYTLFMDLSGRVEGHAAMERIKTRYTSPEVTVLDDHVRCMTAWAETSPAEAIKWWNDLEDGSFRSGMAKSIIAGVVKTDMPRALEYLKLFPGDERGQHAGAFVSACLEQGGPQRAVAWLKSVDMPSGGTNPFHLHAAHAIVSSMVNVSPAEKAAHLQPLLHEPWFGDTGSLQKIMMEWAKKDPAAASAWLAAHRTIPVFAKAADAFVSEWSQAAPEAAQQWRQRMQAAQQP